MTPAKKNHDDSDGVPINGKVPTDKWGYWCWLSGQMAKGGPLALVVLLMMGGIYLAGDKFLTSQTAVLEKLARDLEDRRSEFHKYEMDDVKNGLNVQAELQRATQEASRTNQILQRAEQTMVESVKERKSENSTTHELLQKIIENQQKARIDGKTSSIGQTSLSGAFTE